MLEVAVEALRVLVLGCVECKLYVLDDKNSSISDEEVLPLIHFTSPQHHSSRLSLTHTLGAAAQSPRNFPYGSSARGFEGRILTFDRRMGRIGRFYEPLRMAVCQWSILRALKSHLGTPCRSLCATHQRVLFLHSFHVTSEADASYESRKAQCIATCKSNPLAHTTKGRL